VLFILLMNLKEKPSSNKGVVQRKVVTYGRNIKDWREEKELRPFWCSLISSFNHFTENLHGCPINHLSIEKKNKIFGLFFFFNLFINLTEKHQSSITKKQKKIESKKKKSFYLFGVLHSLHESKKTFIHKEKCYIW